MILKIKCITGCPGSGKSTYVEKNHGDNDIICDYDKIAVAITGKKSHGEKTQGQQHVLNKLRFDIIRAAMSDDLIDTLWMISSNPSEQLKGALGLDCEYIELKISEEEAKKRIENDPTREDKKSEYERLEKYFEKDKRYMPIRQNREYRGMPILATNLRKRIDTDYYVEGFATTFDEPYILYEIDGIQYKEIIDRNALIGADMKDVLFQYNHSGRVYARTKMKNGKEPTLILESTNHGLFVACDLGLTKESRKMYEDIESGLIYQMSWSFTVAEDEYDKKTHTRRIKKIDKIYDVSAVDLPANTSTDISARNYFDGVIEMEKQELFEREKKIRKIKILMEV